MFDELVRDLMENHRGKIIGSLVGLVLSLMIIRYGFFWSVFISLLVLAGYLIGKRVDETKEDLWDLLDKFLPSGHR